MRDTRQKGIKHPPFKAFLFLSKKSTIGSNYPSVEPENESSRRRWPFITVFALRCRGRTPPPPPGTHLTPLHRVTQRPSGVDEEEEKKRKEQNKGKEEE